MEAKKDENWLSVGKWTCKSVGGVDIYIHVKGKCEIR